MKVLIVENGGICAEWAGELLEEMGHSFLVVENGREAWNWLQKNEADCMITDWMLPDTDGLELCSKVRSRQENTYMYCLLMSAKTGRGEMLAALKAGADDFIGKPLDAAEFTARMRCASRIVEQKYALMEKPGMLAGTLAMLQQEHGRVVSVLERLPIACVCCDREGIVQEWNRAASRLFGYPPHIVLQKPVSATLYRHWTQERVEARMQQVLNGCSSEGVEWEYPHPLGRMLSLVCSEIPLLGPSGEITGYLHASVDITERKQLEIRLEEQLRISKNLNSVLEVQRKSLIEANAQLEKMSLQDSQTGLMNRRSFLYDLERHCARAMRHNSVFSILLLDVRQMRIYNERHGYLAGDEALLRITAVLRDALRSQDSIARFGGDEFAALLPDTGIEGALETARRICQKVEELPTSESALKLSAGCAQWQNEQDTANRVLERAEEAMRQAGSHPHARTAAHGLPQNKDTQAA